MRERDLTVNDSPKKPHQPTRKTTRWHRLAQHVGGERTAARSMRDGHIGIGGSPSDFKVLATPLSQGRQ